MAKQPQVLWAQRESLLYITIEVDEAKIEDLKADANKLHFQGSSKSEKYATTLEFYEEVDPSSLLRIGSSTRVVELVISKKVPSSTWWPRLLKEKGKVHWLKVDFSKWKDEDDEEEPEEPAVGGGLGNGFDLNQYMSSLGGSGGGEFDGLDEDEDMPDLEDNEEEEEGKTEIKA
ncbi:unnamed protein product [Caenorhabditis sp. 36 PRJEB53466]|nr:unnamed protein product [Caenorhabditis sp. 36 PRJEB53466]